MLHMHVARPVSFRTPSPCTPTCVLAVTLQVLQKVVDDQGGNDEAHVLSGRQALKRDARHLVAHQHRAAAVAAVDAGVDLDGQQAGAAVRVLRRYRGNYCKCLEEITGC